MKTTLADILLALHISAGMVALATFLVPLVTAKGGRWHRRVGWIFVTAMTVICFSGAPLAAWHYATISRESVRAQFAFLLFITVLSGATTWKGMRVLRFKDGRRNGNVADLGIAALQFGLGLWMLWLGARWRHPILLFFSLAGIGAISDIRYWLNPAKSRMHWFFEHMDGMIGSAIATLTAFAVFGARRFGLDGLGAAAWILPTLILVPVSIVLQKRYARKFGLLTPVAAKAEVATAAPSPSA
jgi:uncharacterized membrane protein